jgi:hypothetical protein
MPSFITDFVSKKGAKIVRGKLFPRMACGKQLASQFEQQLSQTLSGQGPLSTLAAAKSKASKNWQLHFLTC